MICILTIAYTNFIIRYFKKFNFFGNNSDSTAKMVKSLCPSPTLPSAPRPTYSLT